MPNQRPCIYITTPIFYVNDHPHLGHCYTMIAADILAIFWRMSGYLVKFLTGTDEHGMKVERAAQSCGRTPQEHVDTLSESFRDIAHLLKITHDDFIRTTQPRHYKAAKALWTELEQKGQIYLAPYAGWYSVRDEAFYDEAELINGCAPTGAPVEWLEEPCYFFRLSHWQDALLRHYEKNPDAIAPKSRLNETLGFIKQGLTDLAISRSRLTWGIPVPGSSSHVMYVWIDALTNYISALGYPDRMAPGFQDFWHNSLHLLGKDILRFHSVYWPAFLMAAGLQPPKRLFVHGWWTRDKEKMSKSIGNVVQPKDLLEKYGCDAVRYFLFREMPFGQDGDFSDAALVRRLNEELANDFGNLAQRILSFIQKENQGKVPPRILDEGQEWIDWGRGAKDVLTQFMHQQDVYRYIQFIMKAIHDANRYVTQLEPWVLAKGEKSQRDQMDSGLHAMIAFLRDVSLFLHPIIPGATRNLLIQLNAVDSENLSFSEIGTSLSVQTLPAPQALFSKIF